MSASPRTKVRSLRLGPADAPISPMLPPRILNIRPLKKSKKDSSNKHIHLNFKENTDEDENSYSFFPSLQQEANTRPDEEEECDFDEALVRFSPISPSPNLKSNQPRSPAATSLNLKRGVLPKSTPSKVKINNTNIEEKSNVEATQESPIRRKSKKLQPRALPSSPEVDEISQGFDEGYKSIFLDDSRKSTTEQYHAKMQARYTQIRAMRSRIQYLEEKVLDYENISDKYILAKEKLEKMQKIMESPEFKMSKEKQEKQHSKIQKLEKYLSKVKCDVKIMENRLKKTHEGDEALIDTLTAKLEYEKAGNKVLSKQLRDSKESFRITIDRLAAVENKAENEKQVVDELTEQIQEISQRSISDNRRKNMYFRINNAVRTMGKHALKSRMEALHVRLLTAEHDARKSDLELKTLKKEKSVLLAALDRRQESYNEKSMLYNRNVRTLIETPGILTIFRGGRIIDDQILTFHVLFEYEKECAMHFVAYDSERLQSDCISFYEVDLKRIIAGYRFYLNLDLPNEKQKLNHLMELLFRFISVGFKNDNIFIFERASEENRTSGSFLQTIVLFCGTETISGFPMVVQISEVSYLSQWWLEFAAFSAEGDTIEEELKLEVDAATISAVCPEFTKLCTFHPQKVLDYKETCNSKDFYIKYLISQLRVEVSNDSRQLVLNRPVFCQRDQTISQAVADPSDALIVHNKLLHADFESVLTVEYDFAYRTVKLINNRMYTVVVSEEITEDSCSENLLYALLPSLDFSLYDPDTEQQYKINLSKKDVYSFILYSYLAGRLPEGMSKYLILTTRILNWHAHKKFIQFFTKKLCRVEIPESEVNGIIFEFEGRQTAYDWVYSSSLEGVRTLNLLDECYTFTSIECIGSINESLARSFLHSTDRKSEQKKSIRRTDTNQRGITFIKLTSSKSCCGIALIVVTTMSSNGRIDFQHALLYPKYYPIEFIYDKWNRIKP